MPWIEFVQPNGARRVVEVDIGKTIMRGAIENNVKGIEAICGGECACATCHVYVDEHYLEKLTAPSVNEHDLLTCVAAEQRNNSRLSCQITMTAQLDGIVVHLPDKQT